MDTNKRNHLFCLLCNSKFLSKLNQYSFAYLVKCKKCDFIFCEKIPDENELAKHYGNYPRKLKISELTIARYNELLDEFEKYRNNNTLLDLGCGDGYFLEVAKKRDWNVYGTEYSEKAVINCSKKGIPMHLGQVNNLIFSPIKFDVITSFEVIEHINNPLDELAAIFDLLEKKGVVYITTPNFNSLSRYILKDKWSIIEYPEHLSYYTPKTMTSLLKNFNFKLLEIKTTGVSINRFKQGINLFNESNAPFKSDNDLLLRGKIEKSFLLKMVKNVVNRFLTIVGIGDTIKITFKKRI